MKLRFRSLIRLLLVTVLAVNLVLLTNCSSSQAPALGVPENTTPQINPVIAIPDPLDAWPEEALRSPDVPEEYTLAADNENLGLYINQSTSALLVLDKRNGRHWRSSPEGLQESKGITNLWKRQIEIPFLVSYVDEERNQTKVAKPERSEFSIQPVQQGVQITYTYAELQLAFSAVVTIQSDYLMVTVPDDSIEESGLNKLVGIEVLSFMGAVVDGEDGYIFYPDGSGALMKFTSNHPEAVQKISNTIYGTDEFSTTSNTFRESQVMPVFGLVHGDAGFVSILSQGDFDSVLSVARSGKGIPYNHIWAEFIYRRQGRFSLTGGQPTWLYQPDRTHVDSQIRYYFLTQEHANYVGMAARYRQFLMDERGAKKVSENEPLMYLGFVMGIERSTWFLRDLITMTTFKEVETIIEDLYKAGVERADVTLFMWNRGAVSQKYPKRLPVEKDFGGDEALRSLADALHSRSQRLFLNDNYFQVAPGSTQIFPYLDAMRGVDGLPVGNSDVGYFLNPQVALRRFAAKDVPIITQLGADGLAIDLFASLTLPDKNTQYPLSREQFAASWMQLATLSREQMGFVALGGSNVYAVPYTDRLDFVTMDSTHYDLFDETVPFYHIAIHGLVIYTSPPYNLHNDGHRTFLRTVEYGAIPALVLSKENSAQLFRTNLNSVWSSQYDFWRDEVIRQYEDMRQLAPLQNQFITGREHLAEGIIQITYENSTRVVVNYNEIDYVDGSLTVPAMDFIVIQGDK